MTIAELREFLFWCLLVNAGIYCVTALGILSFRELVVRINARVLGLDEAAARRSLQAYLGAFKLLVTVFFFAPWVALLILR